MCKVLGLGPRGPESVAKALLGFLIAGWLGGAGT